MFDKNKIIFSSHQNTIPQRITATKNVKWKKNAPSTVKKSHYEDMI